MVTRTTVPSAKTRRVRLPDGRAKATKDARALVKPKVQKLLDGFALENVLSHLLRRAHFVAEEMFAREFASASITPRQKAALVVLYQSPGLSQSALSDRLHMDRNTTAEMVRRLVAVNLIRRERVASDARAYELFLAADGARVLTEIMARDLEVEQRLAQKLPPELLPIFLKCLALLTQKDSVD